MSTVGNNSSGQNPFQFRPNNNFTAEGFLARLQRLSQTSAQGLLDRGIRFEQIPRMLQQQGLSADERELLTLLSDRKNFDTVAKLSPNFETVNGRRQVFTDAIYPSDFQALFQQQTELVPVSPLNQFPEIKDLLSGLEGQDANTQALLLLFLFQVLQQTQNTNYPIHNNANWRLSVLDWLSRPSQQS